MSKAQMIEAIVLNVEDGDVKETVKQGLQGATLIALEFIQKQVEASKTQQNKQINKQTKIK